MSYTKRRDNRGFFKTEKHRILLEDTNIDIPTQWGKDVQFIVGD